LKSAAKRLTAGPLLNQAGRVYTFVIQAKRQAFLIELPFDFLKRMI
jgi:hypothetical protein